MALEKRQVYLQGLRKVGPFTNRDTGEVVEGYNAFYFDPKEKSDVGYTPNKKFLQVNEACENLKNGEGIYNLLLEIDISSARPRLLVKGFEFLESKPLKV